MPQLESNTETNIDNKSLLPNLSVIAGWQTQQSGFQQTQIPLSRKPVEDLNDNNKK